MSFRNAGNPLCWTDQQRGFPVFTKQTEGNRLIICLLICSCIVYLTFSCHNITFEIFVISRNLVYHASIRKKLDDAVRSCLYDLMVTAGKQDDTREFDHTIIQCGDGFHIQVVCRLIKDQNVASHDHHAGEKDTDFFSTGEDTHLFYTIFTGKKHTAEETADISCVFDLGVLGQPVNDQLIGIKDGGIILREIRLACCNSPFVRSFIRFHFPGENFKQCCLCKLISTDKGDFVIVSDNKGNVVKNFYTVNGFTDSVYGQNFISDFTVWTEINVRIFTAGRTDVI